MRILTNDYWNTHVSRLFITFLSLSYDNYSMYAIKIFSSNKTRGSINKLIQFQCLNKPNISFVLFPMVINVALGKFVLLSYKWSMWTNIFCRHLPKKKNLVVNVNIFQLSNDRYIKSRTWSYWITEFVFNLLFHHISSM